MSFIKDILGISQKELWEQIAKEIGGEYIRGSFWEAGELRFKHNNWEILLDTEIRTFQQRSRVYTIMRAPFINKTGLSFKVYRENFLSDIGKFFGMEDIKIGDENFDPEFIIQSNMPDQIKLLFEDQRFKSLIDSQDEILLEIKGDQLWFSDQYPQGVDVLHFECSGFLQERAALLFLFSLFTVTLERLQDLDIAGEEHPGIRLY